MSPDIRQKETHGVGIERRDSLANMPQSLSIFTPIAPRFSCWLAKVTASLRVVSASMVSGFRNRIYLPLANSTAWLFAREKPTLRALAM